MSKKIELPNGLKEKPFSRRDAEKYGINKDRLARLYILGVVERVAWGVYRAANRDLREEDRLIAATKKAGKESAICLLSALAYHDLTDEIPDRIWIMVPAQCHIVAKELRLLRVANPLWSIGIVQCDGFKITSIERSIVESLIRRRQMGSRIGIESMRTALELKKTTLAKIFDTAKELGVAKRIQTYIEVFG